MGTQFNLFPLVLDSNGAPWAEATMYILSRLENSVNPSMSTFKAIADDLAAFLRFIEETGVDWTDFSGKKLQRPTYRYRAEVWLAVTAGKLAASTGRRRMGTVIAFYQWLRNEGVLTLEHAPWIESDRYIEFKGSHGSRGYKKVTTTDLRISVPKQDDPYSQYINDGGKLRPLPEQEQRWLVDALAQIGNTELTLIHMVALLTGARIQTVLTLRVRHASLSQMLLDFDEVRLPVGPGTGVDTKNNKRLILHFPAWFHTKLAIYASSERAKSRRLRAPGGDHPDQYLFLSVRGMPLYESKVSGSTYNDGNTLRHNKDGQGVRQLIADYVIPHIRRNHDASFHYRFHDLRASFGMNLTDAQLKLVAAGKITLHEAREFVRTRMGHESAVITDGYLQHRGRLQFMRHVNDEYGEHLKNLVSRAFEGTL
jgi:integrase